MWLTKFATLNIPSKYLDPTTYQYNCFFNAIFKQKEILLHCNSWWVYRCKSPRYKSWEDAITSATQKWSVCLLHQLNASYNLNMVMLNRNFLFQRLIFKFHIHTYFHIDTITTKKDMPKKRAHTHTHASVFLCNYCNPRPHHQITVMSKPITTVDGRNPAPVDMVQIPIIYQGFMHVGWLFGISEPSTVLLPWGDV